MQTLEVSLISPLHQQHGRPCTPAVGSGPVMLQQADAYMETSSDLIP